MQRTRIRLALGAWAVVAIALGADLMRGESGYRLTIDSDLKLITSKAPPILTRCIDEFDYRLTRSAARVEVAVDRMSVSTTIDEGLLSRIELSRSGTANHDRGEYKTLGRAGANPKLLEMLDAFEVPLAVLTLDPEGAEIGRELRVKKGLPTDFDLVDNARIFHPRYAKDRPEWDATAVLPIGHGQKARGTLHYARSRVQRADGMVDFDVAGRLQAEGKVGQSEIKKGNCTVKGVQTYDPALNDWAAGRLTIDMDFEGATLDGSSFRGQGPVVITLTPLDRADKAKEKAKESP